MRRLAIAVTILLAASTVVPLPASASGHDGGCGADAGDTFDDATAFCGDPPVDCDNDVPYDCYPGSLNGPLGDTDDFYRIPVQEGDQLVVDVYGEGCFAEPIQLLDPNGAVISTSTRACFNVPNPLAPMRVELERAAVSGDYRLHVQAQGGIGVMENYRVCVRPCEGPIGVQHVDILAFWNSLRNTDVQVLLVPPAHGNLGNASDPDEPSAQDYINETLEGINEWEWALDAFAQDHPEYSYLENLTMEVEVFDGVTPIDPAGYDVIVGYGPSGPVFRGVAARNPVRGQGFLEPFDGIADARYTGRYIVLSTFAASPRAGQAAEDFPELNDIHGVTMHEFAHTFGLGHTWTWTQDHGPDLMNSPASFVYGDGDPAGDGGERTDRECISSLDLYGMAVLYEWIPTGSWSGTSQTSATLPSDISYTLYCPP